MSHIISLAIERYSYHSPKTQTMAMKASNLPQYFNFDSRVSWNNRFLWDSMSSKITSSFLSHLQLLAIQKAYWITNA